MALPLLESFELQLMLKSSKRNEIYLSSIFESANFTKSELFKSCNILFFRASSRLKESRRIIDCWVVLSKKETPYRLVK